jgi:propionyl-CoA synthetase
MLPCLDKQDGYGDQVAFIYDSPVTQTIRKYTFLSKNRSSKTRWRDAILRIESNNLYAYWQFSSFGFAPHELAIRIDDCKPLIITASSGIEVDKLIPINSG